MKFREAVRQRKFRNVQTESALNIIFTANWLEELTRDILQPYEISSEQYNVLRILKGNHPEAYSLQEIRNRMLNKWSNVSRLVEKLRKKEYLSRQPMPDNRRKVEIRITDKGLAFLDELSKLPIAGNLYQQALDEKEAEQLTSLLDRFRSNLEEHIAEEDRAGN